MMKIDKKIFLPVGIIIAVLLLVVVASMMFKGGAPNEKTKQAAIDNTEQRKGTCIPQTKNAGRKLLEPQYANNTPLTFDTGPECNIFGRLKQGSIVLYRSPRGPDPITLKVAGLPGDEIGLNGSALSVNGKEFRNSKGQIYNLGTSKQRAYINEIKTQHGGKLPKGFYFLMGDSDKVFLDSSRFGMSDGKDILGVLAE